LQSAVLPTKTLKNNWNGLKRFLRPVRGKHMSDLRLHLIIEELALLGLKNGLLEELDLSEEAQALVTEYLEERLNGS
jgi:hypothetical protein